MRYVVHDAKGAYVHKFVDSRGPAEPRIIMTRDRRKAAQFDGMRAARIAALRDEFIFDLGDDVS